MNNYNSAQYKLYNFEIYDKDIIIRNILPCISKENKIGICDLVNEKFYFNANKSDFKYGTLKSYVNSNNIIDKERTLYANWKKIE